MTTSSTPGATPAPQITEITRKKITDWMRVESFAWWGSLDDVDFLSRLFDLADIRSYDRRFPNASGDIWQHRVINDDWDDNWIFKDSRFGLERGPDETFLRFLAETVHPVVRSDEEEVRRAVETYNQHLRRDGWELRQVDNISGHPIFEGRRLCPGAEHAINDVERASEILSSHYVDRQIRRLRASVESDPELAIGTAKELVETICKAIIEQRAEHDQLNSDDLPSLARAALKSLRLTREDIPEPARGAKTIKRLLSNFGQVVQALAELRNHYGTGHGKRAGTRSIQPRHARLAVGAASAFATFVLETHVARPAHSEEDVQGSCASSGRGG